MKGIKLARKQDPDAKHDDKRKKEWVKEESFFLGRRRGGTVLVTGNRAFALEIFLALPIQRSILPSMVVVLIIEQLKTRPDQRVGLGRYCVVRPHVTGL